MTNNKALHINNAAYVTDANVRDAYMYLVGYASCLAGFDCYPQIKGEVRDFRYFRGDSQPFAFIVNRKSLLFYFRKPAEKHHARNISFLSGFMPEVSENAAGELTVRITSIADAQKLMKAVLEEQEA